jgi:hypothetical protein
VVPDAVTILAVVASNVSFWLNLVVADNTENLLGTVTVSGMGNSTTASWTYTPFSFLKKAMDEFVISPSTAEAIRFPLAEIVE